MLSLPTDGNYANKMALHQTEAQKKAANELLQFRDFSQGSRPDNASVTAVRRLLADNIAQFPEKIKNGFAKIFDSLISGKPLKGTMPIHSKNFVTSSNLAVFRRDEGKSAYITINDNTLRISHHATTAEMFFEYDEAGDNIISIVIEKSSGKRFKLDYFANNEYAMYKGIAVKEITPAVRGITGKNNLANPPVQVFDINNTTTY